MVSSQVRYETSSQSTNFPQTIFLANTGNVAHAVDPYWTQPSRPAHHSDGD